MQNKNENQMFDLIFTVVFISLYFILFVFYFFMIRIILLSFYFYFVLFYSFFISLYFFLFLLLTNIMYIDVICIEERGQRRVTRI